MRARPPRPTSRAESRILGGLRAAQAVVHVHSGDAIAEGTEHVPQACRVGAARHETRHLAPGRDQLVAADRLFDANCKGAGHPPIVPSLAVESRRVGDLRGWRKFDVDGLAVVPELERDRGGAACDACSVPETSMESFRTRPFASIQTSSGTAPMPD